jgi:hypothetical protein
MVVYHWYVFLSIAVLWCMLRVPIYARGGAGFDPGGWILGYRREGEAIAVKSAIVA